MSCRHADSGSAVLVSGGGRRLASRLEAHFTSLESGAAMSWRLRRDAITGARDLLTSQLRHVWCARSRCSRDSRKRIRSSDVRRVRLASNQANLCKNIATDLSCCARTLLRARVPNVTQVAQRPNFYSFFSGKLSDVNGQVFCDFCARFVSSRSATTVCVNKNAKSQLL